MLQLIAMGYSSEHAATALGIRVRTAEKHLEHCYRALKVNSRSEASRVAWAATRAVFPADPAADALL